MPLPLSYSVRSLFARRLRTGLTVGVIALVVIATTLFLSLITSLRRTLVTTGEGEWTVEVLQGTRRTIRPTPVSPAAVAQAAKLLTEEVSEIVEGVLNAARAQQLARVEQLRAELEAAQKALDDLGA